MRADRLGATLAECLVGSGAADIVGVAFDPQAQVGMLLQHAADLLEGGAAVGADAIAVAVEQDPAYRDHPVAGQRVVERSSACGDGDVADQHGLGDRRRRRHLEANAIAAGKIRGWHVGHALFVQEHLHVVAVGHDAHPQHPGAVIGRAHRRFPAVGRVADHQPRLAVECEKRAGVFLGVASGVHRIHERGVEARVVEIELDGEPFWQGFRQRDVESALCRAAQVAAALPVDHLQVAIAELQAPWEVADPVSAAIFGEKHPVAGDEVEVPPCALARTPPCGADVTSHGGWRRSAAGLRGSAVHARRSHAVRVGDQAHHPIHRLVRAVLGTPLKPLLDLVDGTGEHFLQNLSLRLA